MSSLSLIVKSLSIIQGTAFKLSSALFTVGAADYSLSISVLGGSLYSNGVEVGASGSFSLTDLKAGKVSFLADGLSVPSFFFQAQANGFSASAEVQPVLSYKAVNQAPILSVPGLGSDAEVLRKGGSLTITRDMISASDAETPFAGNICFKITKVAGGSFLLNGFAAKSFSLADIDAGSVSFKHDGKLVAPSFTLSAIDSDGKASIAKSTALASVHFDGSHVAEAASITLHEIAIKAPLAITEGATLKLSLSKLPISVPPEVVSSVNLPSLILRVDNAEHLEILVTGKTEPQDSFTVSELKAGLVSLRHDGGQEAPSLALTLLNGEVELDSLSVPFVFKTVNDLPILSLNPLVLNPGETQLLNRDLFGVSDEETLETLEGAFRFTVKSAKGIEFHREGITASLKTFSLADVNDGLISVTRLSSFVGTPGYSLSVSDPTGKLGTFANGVILTNHSPEGSVSIAGTLAEGQTLSAVNTLADTDSVGSVSYTWLDASDAMLGHGDSLVLTQAHVGKQIKVLASYVDGQGTEESMGSSLSGTIANINNTPAGAVAITGISTQGQVLTAGNNLADIDGLGSVSYSWKDASGNTLGSGNQLALTQAQVGQQIQVIASYTDAYGRSESVASSLSAAVANINDAPTGAVIISGSAIQGETLTASASSVADLDGRGILSYTWQDGAGNVLGTGTSLTLSQAHVGLQIQAIASYTDLLGAAESVSSALTSTIANVNDAPTGWIGLTPNVREDQPLTFEHQIADADGLGELTFNWQSASLLGGGAVSVWSTIGSGLSFTPGDAQVGKIIRVVASYTDAAGTSESVISSTTGNVTSVNDARTGSVTISGSTTQGQMLSAANTFADADGLGSVSYTWKDENGVTLATGSSFVLTQAQVGKQIQVSASYLDDQGTVESAESALSAMILNVNDLPTGTVTVSGTATEGQTLTATNSLADADGLGTIVYSWQDALGNTVGSGSSLTLNQALVGKNIQAVASYTDAWGAAETKASSFTTAVVNINDSPTGTVSFAGIVQEDQILSASNSLADVDGLGMVTYTWQSSSNGSVWTTIGTGETFTLGDSQVGKQIRAVAGYTDAGGNAESVASAASSSVLNVPDAPSGAVTLLGSLIQGQTLTAANSLADADGLGNVSYNWMASTDGNVWDLIASGAALVLTQVHVGKLIKVIGSYTDAQGAAESVSSSPSAPIANLNDLPAGTVTVTGTATQGQTLRASNTLVDADGMGEVSYTWKDASGNILGSSNQITLTQALVGKQLKVTAAYTDALGAAETRSSSYTAPVVNLNDAPTGTVSISGTATEDQILTASHNLADIDGLGAIGYTWQVSSNGTSWTNTASGSSLTLGDAHAGKQVRVTASYTDAQGTVESVMSSPLSIGNINDAPTGALTINGTKTQGQTLTVGSTIADADGLGTRSYVWKDSSGNILSTASSLTLTQAHVGKTLQVIASYTDAFGAEESVSSSFTATIANLNDAPSGSVSISGTAREDQVLSASNSLADADGMGTVSYIWQVSSNGSTWTNTGSGPSLTLGDAHGGRQVRALATYTDALGSAESVSSAAVVITNVNDALTGTVSIAGTTSQGQTLTASNTFADADGLGNISYQWQDQNGTVLGSGSSFVLTQSQVNKTVRVVASYTDAQGTFESLASSYTGAVSNINDAPAGAVTISGSKTQGQTLTASHSLSDADGLGSVTYQWQDQTGAVLGAANTLFLSQAQVGKTLRVIATYTDGFGAVETAASSYTAAIANLNDAPAGTVTINGNATQGETLTASSNLSDVDGLGAISYQWQDQNGAIQGTGSSFVLTQAQVGNNIKAVARYTDAYGQSESVASAWSSLVANINDPLTGSLSINGGAYDRSVLSVVQSLVDLDGFGSLTYTWKDQAGSTLGTGSSFTLNTSHIGKTVQVIASYTDFYGVTETKASNFTNTIGVFNNQPSGSVSVSGSYVQGQTLTAANTLQDLDGMGSAPIIYQWKDAAGNLVGSNGPTLSLTQAHVGKQIKASAFYVDGLGISTAVESVLSSVVTNINDAPTGSVAISGVAIAGQTLNATNTLADADGLGTIGYTWKDQAGSTLGTGSSLVLTEAMRGKQIKVTAKYTDGQGALESVDSALTSAVLHQNRAPTGAVAINGVAAWGSTLTATNTLADADGLGAVNYTWQTSTDAVTWTDYATGVSLVLANTLNLNNKKIRLVARYTDSYDFHETAISDHLTSSAFNSMSTFGYRQYPDLPPGAQLLEMGFSLYVSEGNLVLRDLKDHPYSDEAYYYSDRTYYASSGFTTFSPWADSLLISYYSVPDMPKTAKINNQFFWLTSSLIYTGPSSIAISGEIATTSSTSWIGIANADNFIGDNIADDTFTQISTGDSVKGMGGNDIIRLASNDFTLIDGGAGTDTLKLSANLDLKSLPDTILKNLEVIDLEASGATLTMEFADVLAMSGGTGSLTIKGTSGTWDKEAGWAFSGTANGFETYTNGVATVLLQNELNVI
ncbi:MAG: hypothetical protein RL095_3846 [Verrucomicrobiota bacterium]|jgi:hypothetical protein